MDTFRATTTGNFADDYRTMTPEDCDDSGRRRGIWMAAAQDGDRAAYTALLDDIGPMIRRYVQLRVRDTVEAQDVYQDVLMAIHSARHTYAPDRPFDPWLFAITRRVVARRHGERTAREGRELLLETMPEIAVDSDGPLKTQLEQAVLGLSPDQREALTLLKIDGLSIKAAAPRAGTTVGALKVRAHRAYRALRRLL